MKDMQARLEKLKRDAAECALIRDLATAPKKRKLFARLADHLLTCSHRQWSRLSVRATTAKFLLICHDSNIELAFIAPTRPPASPRYRSVIAYRVEINPLSVATIQWLPQRTIGSIRPMPETVSPRIVIRRPSGPSRTAVPPRTSSSVQPATVVGLVSGVGVSGPLGAIVPVTVISDWTGCETSSRANVVASTILPFGKAIGSLI